MISDEGYITDSPRASPNGFLKVTDHMTHDFESYFAEENAKFKAKYKISKLLNNSANGVIYEGYRRMGDNSDKIGDRPGDKIVAKQVPKSKIGRMENLNGRNIPLEFYLQIIASSKSSGVVKALDIYERRTSWVLVMEKPTRSRDLFEILNEMGRMSESCVRVISKQIIETCCELAKAGVFHRDIKDENILVNASTLETKIIDFGCGEIDQSNARFTNFCGTPEFAPPEALLELGYSADSATVWTIGTLLYTMLVGDIPFESRDDILAGKFRHDISSLSTQSQKIIKSCLALNSSKRPKLGKIVDFDFFDES